MTDLLVEKHGPIATLTINRPEVRNILGEPGDGALFEKAAADINADRSLRCAILTGAGPVFSAGGNIKAMQEKSGLFAGTPDEIAAAYKRDIHGVVRALWSIEVPLVAAVNGAAIGLGNDVACLADIRIAADTAVFSVPFLKLGLVPGDGGAWLLPRVLGLSRTAELLFTGETIDASTALRWGLVSQVVPIALLMGEARGLAVSIARQPPGVLRKTKALMRQGLVADFDAVMEASAEAQGQAHASMDHAEALAAFFAKRPPVFRGE
jgi:enoyl-CoA hydratase/carnithine racemase